MLRKVSPNQVFMSTPSAVFKIKKDIWKVELFPQLTLIHSRG